MGHETLTSLLKNQRCAFSLKASSFFLLKSGVALLMKPRICGGAIGHLGRVTIKPLLMGFLLPCRRRVVRGSGLFFVGVYVVIFNSPLPKLLSSLPMDLLNDCGFATLACLCFWCKFGILSFDLWIVFRSIEICIFRVLRFVVHELDLATIFSICYLA
ncbi:unnamed protein product [Vicia faba]|uniref:Uncharacterized protein n=1 Tax=Vicia faba TaxID=3906 RepID=A0AAV0Z804_VICFA|nr:unnamed protein product [Vicia faba]